MEEGEPQIYVPYAQRPEANLFLVALTAQDPLSALPAWRASRTDPLHALRSE